MNVWRERTVLLRSGTPNTLGVDSRCRLTDLLFVHHLHRSSSVSRCIDSEAEPRDYGLRWTRRLETLNAPSTSVVHTSTYESNTIPTYPIATYGLLRRIVVLGRAYETTVPLLRAAV